jgi:homoserine O-acetyltransferase
MENLSLNDYETYKLGDWKLQCGSTLPNARIAYKTFGDPKSPAIVYPTWYSGCQWPLLIGCREAC